MWKPLHPLYNLYRRWFGTYVINDPRLTKASAPYTYYLPSETRQNSVAVGDSVKLVISSVPDGLKHDAERMWVEVTEVTGDDVVGKLANIPFDMPQLRFGDVVNFKAFHIIDFKTERPLPDEPKQSQYWDRCFVDDCVLNDKVPVYYIYREEPDSTEPENKYPDSGWRIRGDYRHLSNEEFEARKFSYIALGKVLNADDSWLHLIDAPVGSAFYRNFETGEYEPYDRPANDDD